MKKTKTAEELVKISQKARQLMVETLVCAGCGHPGGAFSSIDMMTALYFNAMKIDPQNPSWGERDRFILSKGHSSIALYTILHLKGFIDRDMLLTFRQDNSTLCGHPDMHKVPGVEMSTGSLGHGLSIGVGIAKSAAMDRKNFKVYVMMGDGETQEGSVWEAAMFAGHHKLENLVGIVDRNKLQIDGFTEDILSLEPYRGKWESFGWEVREVDGHNMDEIISCLRSVPFKKGKPSMIISNTVKGKGISFMENKAEWHGKALKGDHAEIAKKDVHHV